MVFGRIFWSKVKTLWEKAKEGGAILSQPKRYLSRVFLPSFLSWMCKLLVIAIFLAAFAIPVTFESVMWVCGSGSLANVVSVTPGAVGITQATNALALSTCCDVPKAQAVDYSTAQQLITTAWNIFFALVLVVCVFGWSGGKVLVGDSYTDAKAKVAEQKTARAEKKATKREQRRGVRRGQVRPPPPPLRIERRPRTPRRRARCPPTNHARAFGEAALLGARVSEDPAGAPDRLVARSRRSRFWRRRRSVPGADDRRASGARSWSAPSWPSSTPSCRR